MRLDVQHQTSATPPAHDRGQPKWLSEWQPPQTSADARGRPRTVRGRSDGV